MSLIMEIEFFSALKTGLIVTEKYLHIVILLFYLNGVTIGAAHLL